MFQFFSFFQKENINYPMLFTTVFFFLLGLLLFIRRLYWIPRIQGVYPREQRWQRERRFDREMRSDFDNLEDEINISVQIGQERKNFSVKKSETIGSFIESKIKPLNNNKDSNLIFQGVRLDKNQTFENYSRRLVNGSVLLNQTIENENQSRNEGEAFFQNSEEEDDLDSVNIYTLLMYLVFFLIAVFFIFCKKKYEKVLPGKTIFCMYILLISWAFFFSQTLAKLVYKRKISF